MKLSSTGSLAVCVLAATASAAANIIPATGKTVLPRPALKAGPFHPGKPMPHSPARQRDRFCFVQTSRCGGDDAPAILRAFHECNNGGTVVLYADYTVASPLDLTFLNAVDVAITGTINFAPDIDYWSEHSFKYQFQNSSSMWRWGGRDVNIFGGGVGTINGNGQSWWEASVSNKYLLRPVLFVVDGLEGGSMSGINMVNPPMVRGWCRGPRDI